MILAMCEKITITHKASVFDEQGNGLVGHVASHRNQIEAQTSTRYSYRAEHMEQSRGRMRDKLLDLTMCNYSDSHCSFYELVSNLLF